MKYSIVSNFHSIKLLFLAFLFSSHFSNAQNTSTCNSSLNLDGINDYGSIANSFFQNANQRNFTIEFYMKPNSTQSQYPGIWGKTGFWNEINVHLYVPGKVGFFYATSVNGNQYFQTDTVFWTANKWDHYAIVGDAANNQLRIYKNGILDATTSHGTPNWSIPNNDSKIGAVFQGWVSPGTQYFRGKIDDFRVSDTIRYSSNFAPPRNLKSDNKTRVLYDFNTSINGIVPDLSGNSNNLSLQNGALIDPTDVPYNSYSRSVSLGNDTSVCNLDSLMISASAGFNSYIWNTNDTSRSIYVKQSGKVSIVAIDSFGCMAYDTITFSILNPRIKPRDTVVCKGSEVTLKGDLKNSNSYCGYIPNNLKSGLVAWYPFCGNANDGSGNGLNGTVSGASLTADRFGNPNSAFLFDGVDDYISSTRSYLSVFTVSIWYNPSSNLNWNPLIDGFDSNWEVLLKNNYPEFVNWTNSSSYTEYVTSYLSQNNSWCHLVCIFSNSSVKIYINNVLINQITVGGLQNSSGMFYFGASLSGGDQFFYGKLDDVGIWNRALSSAEVSQLYNLESSSAKLTWSTSDTTSTTKITANSNTKVWLKATDGIGTCYDTTNVFVRSKTLDIGKDTIRSCKLDSMQLSGSNGFVSYAWNTGASSKSTYIKSTGKVVLTATDSFGCKAKDSVIVSILNPKITPRDTVVCEGAQVTLRSTINNNNSSNSSCGYMANSLKSGLVAFYPFCGNANDAGVNSYNGTVSNGATLTSDNKNLSNSAYNFDGVDDIINTSLPYTKLLRSKGFTVSSWIKLGTTTTYYSYSIVNNMNPSATQFWMGLEGTQNNGANHRKPSLFFNSFNGGSQVIAVPNYTVQTNTWTHLAFTLKNNTICFYANGVLKYTTSVLFDSLSTEAPAPNVKIGRGNLTPGFYQDFNGDIDDIGIWNRELNSTEIQSLYLSNAYQTKLTWSTSDTTSTTKVTANANMKVWLKATDGIGTCYDTTNVYVSNPQLNVVNDTLKFTACNRDSLMLNVGSKWSSTQWSNGSKDSSIYLKTTGNYKVTVKDQYGCSASDSTYFINPGKPKINTLLADSVNCFAGNDGSITSSYSGGFTPYSFLWDDAGKQTSANAFNLSKGTYKLVLKDAYGCKDSLTANVYEPLKLSSSISFNDSVNCYGGNDGSLQVNVSGGVKNYQYIWNDANQQNTAKASNLKQGSYKVVISDYYNCKDSITAVVSEPAKLQTSMVYADSVNCFGGNDGSIKINVVGGVKNYKFLWSDMQTTQNANNLKKGTYKVLVSDHYNCKDSVSVVINEPLKLQVSLLSNDSVNCFGGNDGNLKINVVGGVKNYKFLWSDNQTTQDAINLKKGTYKVMVSDYYNCKDSLSSIIEEPAKLQVSLVSTDSVNCYAGNDGSIKINVVGGVKNYTYLWSDNQSTQNASSLKKGLYKVMVNDYYQCKDSLSASIYEPAKLTVGLMLVDSVNCFSGSDGSIQVNVSGGVKNYKTVWNDPNKQNTLKASNLKKGLYKVMVSDFYNCKDSLTVKVDEPAKLTASIVLVDSVNCFGGKDGKIQVSVAGGVKNYNYVWNDASKQKTALASNLQKGSYKVLVTDYYACKDSATASVMEPNKLIASINYVDSVNCFGGSDGSITTSISGGVKTYKYIWSDNQKTQNAYNLKKGNYKLIVSDYYNCKDSATATVYEPLKLVVSVVSTDSVNCYGGNDGSIKIKAVGGNNGYSYLWNDINKQKTPLASNLTKGLYKVSVKDIYGCSDSLTANVFEPAKVVLKIQSFRNASCFGYNDGSALASASGGTGAYKYSWNTSPVQSGNTAIGLRKGSYKATVLDAYGCQDTASVIIAEPQQIIPKISGNRLAVRDILHELSSTVTPLQKYTYNWTPSTVFGKPSNLASIKGKFYSTTLVTLRTTDATGCFGEDTATITVFIPFSDFIPTVFSPNGDSHNDVFGLPDYFEITQFDVYNRWGALLFRGSTSNPTWDGIYEGKLVPLGTYMYIIKAKLKNTVYEFEHQGTVTVLR